MTAKNDITGDKIQTKSSSAYADNYDAIFRKEEDKIEKKYENEDEIREYLVNKYNINENYYHPNEIITTILSKHIINNKKIDKKLLHFIN